MNLIISILTLQVVFTIMMTGLIWFVQLVHYPLLSSVGIQSSSQYAREHVSRTAKLVGPLMLGEMLFTVLAVFVTGGLVWILSLFGLFLLLAIWCSTFLIQVPCHTRLTSAFDPVTHRELTVTNWIRTLLWTSRSVLTIWMLVDTAISHPFALGI